MNIFITIIGYLAGSLSIISFIPQAIRTIRTKETKEISLKTYIIYNIANILFLLLGILSISLPIMYPDDKESKEIIIWGMTLILPFSITIMSVSCIIFIKLQNIKKFGESVNCLNKNEKEKDMQVSKNAI